ncbi:MAG: VWA domain-containing protein [Eubacteriales bacterium]|nr:VWA domain-containing protein [Eubacteriales bacterium]
MSKKYMRYLTAILLAVFVLLTLPLTINAASMRCRKIISVVYDDSGSMSGDNEAYANYSMQTFAAMVNEEDDLYITYMSDCYNSRKIDTSDLLNAVGNIRNHTSNGNTPYEAVETAMDRLKQSKDSDPNTQYWLVVFTDGGFNSTGIAEVEKALDKFSRTKMANGSEPHIIYMTIGDGLGVFTPHPSNPDIKVIAANDGHDVADSLFDIASSVTGRFRVDSSAITFTDNHTLTVSSNIPLLNISILVQNVDADVVSILDPDMVPVSIKHEIPVGIPGHITYYSNPDIANMHGVITLAGEEGRNIPAGGITITLSKAISPDDIVVMIEPAIELKIKFYSDGQEITDPDLIAVTMPGLVAKAAVYEYGTDVEILESLLPSGYTKTIEHSIDGKTITSNDSFIIDPLKAEVGNNRVHAELDLEGFFHLEATVDFSPALMQIDSITVELEYDGSPRRVVDGVEDGPDVVYVTRLKDNRTGYRFTICVDGEPIDKQAALALEDKFRECIYADFDNYIVEVKDDGSFLVYPTKQPWYVPTLIYYLRHHGEQTVGVTIDGLSAEGKLDFKLFYDPWEIIIPILWMLLILYIIWWILFKKHFPRVTLCMGLGRRNQFGQITYGNSDQIDLNWLGCFQHRNIFSVLFNLIVLLLPMASRTRFGGYTFIGQRSLVRSANQFLIVRNVKNKAVSSTMKKPNSVSEVSSTELDDKLFIRDGESYVKFWIED